MALFALLESNFVTAIKSFAPYDKPSHVNFNDCKRFLFHDPHYEVIELKGKAARTNVIGMNREQLEELCEQ